VQVKLVKQLIKVIDEFYGQTPELSNSYSRIINSRHVQRIKRLIDSISKSKIAFGGHVNEKDLYISPTLLTDVAPSDLVMQDEIFGPILPFVVFDDMNDGVAYARSR
jgi:aldehyde dehydrogenase (NAD+)